MAVVGQVVIGMKVQTADLKKGLAVAGKDVKGAATSMMGGITSAIPGLGALATAAGVAAAGFMALRSVITNVGQQIDELDKVNKLSERFNVSAEAVIGLQYAFEKLDVSAEEVGTVMAKMQRSISEAANGIGEASAVFQRLGLDVQALNNMSGDQQFKAISDAISKISNQGDRIAILMKLFKETGAKLDPLFRAGGAAMDEYRKKAEELGLIISTTQARALGEMKDKWEDVTGRVTGMWRQFTVAITPVLDIILDTLQELLPNTKDWGDYVWVVAEALKAVAIVIQKVVQFTMVIFKTLQGIINFIIGGIAKIFAMITGVGDAFADDMLGKAEESMNAGADAMERMLGIANETTTAQNGVANSIDGITVANEEMLKGLEKNKDYLASLREEYNTLGMSSRQKGLYDALGRGLAGPELQEAKDLIAKLDASDAMEKWREDAKKAAEYIAKLRGDIEHFGETDAQKQLRESGLKGADLAQANRLTKELEEKKRADGVMKYIQQKQKEVGSFWLSESDKDFFNIIDGFNKSGGVTQQEYQAIQAQFKQMEQLEKQKKNREAAKQLWEETRNPMEQYQQKIAELDQLLQAGADPALIARGIQQAQQDILGMGGQPKYADIATMGSQEAYTDYLSTMYGTPKKDVDKDTKDIAKYSKDQTEYQKNMVTYLQKLASIEYDDVPF